MLILGWDPGKINIGCCLVSLKKGDYSYLPINITNVDTAIKEVLKLFEIYSIKLVSVEQQLKGTFKIQQGWFEMLSSIKKIDYVSVMCLGKHLKIKYRKKRKNTIKKMINELVDTHIDSIDNCDAFYIAIKGYFKNKYKNKYSDAQILSWIKTKDFHLMNHSKKNLKN